MASLDHKEKYYYTSIVYNFGEPNRNGDTFSEDVVMVGSNKKWGEDNFLEHRHHDQSVELIMKGLGIPEPTVSGEVLTIVETLSALADAVNNEENEPGYSKQLSILAKELVDDFYRELGKPKAEA